MQIIYGCCQKKGKKWNCWMKKREFEWLFTLLLRILLAWLLEHFTLIDDVFQSTPQSTYTLTKYALAKNGYQKREGRKNAKEKCNQLKRFSSHTNNTLLKFHFPFRNPFAHRIYFCCSYPSLGKKLFLLSF